jgi:Ca2+-binding EF-hand superfamily protein
MIIKLKAELKARSGNTGFLGLSRKFRIIDDDNDDTLSLAEFKKAMKEMNISLSDTELRKLFEHFDSDGNGGIDYDEFIKGVRSACYAFLSA